MPAMAQFDLPGRLELDYSMPSVRELPAAARGTGYDAGAAG